MRAEQAFVACWWLIEVPPVTDSQGHSHSYLVADNTCGPSSQTQPLIIHLHQEHAQRKHHQNVQTPQQKQQIKSSMHNQRQ